MIQTAQDSLHFTNLDQVFIYKTNICTHLQYELLEKLMNNTSDVLRWNLDIQDVDHVLRIESLNEQSSFYITLLSQSGLFCEELPD